MKPFKHRTPRPAAWGAVIPLMPSTGLSAAQNGHDSGLSVPQDASEAMRGSIVEAIVLIEAGHPTAAGERLRHALGHDQ